MAAPLFYGAGLVGGALAAKLLKASQGRHLCSAPITFPLFAVPIENRVNYPVRHEAVTTTVDIDAPPAVVWRDTVAIARIRPDELHWTVTQDLVGAPKPQDARL